MRLLEKFEANRVFSGREAWLLFRLAAFSEAVGWTLLIAGILIERYITPGNDVAVLIAGNIHGTIYLCYFVAALGLYPSLGWRRWKGVLAVLSGVPPYGSLVFELWESHRRHVSTRQCLFYTALVTT